MRLVLVGMLLLMLGCAHSHSRNLAQRQSAPPRGDFVPQAPGPRPGGVIPMTEPPIVTPVP